MNWKPPQVEVGQSVLYKKSPMDPGLWYPGYVVQANEKCLVLHVFIKTNGQIGRQFEKTRCLHIDDPAWTEPGQRLSLESDDASGCWTLTPRDILLNQLLDELLPKPAKQKRTKEAVEV